MVAAPVPQLFLRLKTLLILQLRRNQNRGDLLTRFVASSELGLSKRGPLCWYSRWYQTWLTGLTAHRTQAPEANAADEMTAKQLEALNLLKTRMNQDDSEEEEKEEDLAPKKYIVFHPCERFHMTWDSVVVAAMVRAALPTNLADYAKLHISGHVERSRLDRTDECDSLEGTSIHRCAFDLLAEYV